MNSDWKNIILENIFNFYNGKAIKPGGIGKYKVYGSNGIIGGCGEFQHDNAIVVGRVGAYCGSIAYCKEKFWASDNTIVAKPKASEINTRYSYYLLQTLNLNNYAGGSAQPLMTQTVLKRIPAIIPNLKIQSKIATILSAYDDLIENNTRRIQILEEMAQRIYREWFVHFRFPGHENVKRVDSELGMIPEGWEVKKLGDVCFILMGQSPKSEYYNEQNIGLPFHQGVKDFGEFFPNDRIYCTLKKRISEKGDILFSVRAPVGRINIANKKIIIGRGLSAIRGFKINQSFLYYQLKNIFKEKDIIGGGTIFKAVTKDDMHSIKIVIPSKIVEGEFKNIVDLILKLIEILTDKNSNLRQTRDLLLPKLISGKIDVSDLEIKMDEIS